MSKNTKRKYIGKGKNKEYRRRIRETGGKLIKVSTKTRKRRRKKRGERRRKRRRRSRREGRWEGGAKR